MITEAKVALKPIDAYPTWALSGSASEIATVAKAIQETIRQGMQPSVFEFID